jgi:hypothetical protein
MRWYILYINAGRPGQYIIRTFVLFLLSKGDVTCRMDKQKANTQINLSFYEEEL